MSWLRFLHRKRSDAELQDEIEAFLTEETADNEARGVGQFGSGAVSAQHNCFGTVHAVAERGRKIRV